MQVTQAGSGLWILDAAGFVATQPVRNACRLAYVDGFSFYLGNRFGVGRDQFQIAFDNGKLVMPNREGDNHEAYSWASGPEREVDEARRLMDALELDWTAVPCVDSAVDWNPSGSELGRCDTWWHRYVDHARAVGFWGGYYGATAYGARLKAFDWWPAHFPDWTWGGAGEIPATNVKQFAGHPSGHDYSSVGVLVDESIVRSGLVMASSFDAAPTPPATGTPQEELMLLTNSEVYPQFAQAQAAGYAPPDGGWPVGWLWWELTDTGKRWVHDADFQARYDWAQANNVQGVKRTTGQLQQIPDWQPSEGGADLTVTNQKLDALLAAVQAPKTLTGTVS